MTFLLYHPGETEPKHEGNGEKKHRNYLPEVSDRVSQRSLCGDVSWLPGVMVKLE